jgi:hypothetical protein
MFLGDVFHFLRTRKRPWLAPLIVLLLAFGAVFVLTQGSILTPFIYALF